MTGANSFFVLPPEELARLVEEAAFRGVARGRHHLPPPSGEPSVRRREAAAMGLMTAEEVSERVHLSARTIRRAVLAGSFPSPIKPTNGRAIRWRPEDVEKWLANREASK